MTADTLREKFLRFFKARKHKIVESDSLVPKDDPTVLFTPAGMNQFKREFLGFDSGFKRAATAQRCLRTDDLDKVGKTSSHHTFFEMLGNFSFGDYFKQEAISWAWEFLTEELKIDRKRLWVSVYKDDAEAYSIWQDKIKVPASRIKRLGDKENFWPSEARQKGPNGPCGPCSEVFFDWAKDMGKNSVEVWNLVFTQFNRKGDGILNPLPRKNIDTGMGLERLAAVIDGVKSNFETGLFQPIIKEIIENVKKSPKLELVYAVSDHIRAVVFGIYDGLLPSNEERGYVIRKLIRRSSMHLRLLGITGPFLYKLAPVVAEVMKAPYPELIERRENIAEIILREEQNFISTFQSSGNLFKEKFSSLLEKQEPEKAGRIAFQLYDTYGIPFELTRDWLDKHKIKFSQASFDKELDGQKTRSKLQSAMKGDVFSDTGLNLKIKASRFLGYEEQSVKAEILAIIKDNQQVDKLSAGENATLILDKTSFYPEGGGQVGDSGEISKGKNIFEVLDTQRNGRLIAHKGRVRQGKFKKQDAVCAQINSVRRLSIARNHTATHLLQAALRKVLGQHVKQQGSLVAEEKLRFDFTHFKDIKEDELERIEEIVNSCIMDNTLVTMRTMALSSAKRSGALAFFAEKYEDTVRMVCMGDFSRELCAGTHLKSAGPIGLFKIINESAVASGIRRIEALTGRPAYKFLKERQSLYLAELEKKGARIKELERQLSGEKFEAVKLSLDSLINAAEEINGKKLITKVFEGVGIDLLRKNIDLIKQKTHSAVICLGSNLNNKAVLVIGITEDLCLKGIDASVLVKRAAGFIGGSGGGRKDFAQAGGNRPEDFSKAFQELKNIISNF